MKQGSVETKVLNQKRVTNFDDCVIYIKLNNSIALHFEKYSRIYQQKKIVKAWPKLYREFLKLTISSSNTEWIFGNIFYIILFFDEVFLKFS